MKIKNIIILLSFLIVAISCQKERDEVSVMYYIKGLAKDYTVSYINEEGKTITEIVSPGTTDNLWLYNFKALPGDIVYLYAKYYDNNPPDDKFRVMIKVDGIMFKYADEYDNSDPITIPGDSTINTVYKVKRSGVVPF